MLGREVKTASQVANKLTNFINSVQGLLRVEDKQSRELEFNLTTMCSTLEGEQLKIRFSQNKETGVFLSK